MPRSSQPSRPSSTSGRSPDRIRHHYEVERELAKRLRDSTRSERTGLFKELYTELFERVPDHPRLTRRQSEEDSRRNVENQLRLIRACLGPEVRLLEFAPGDCRLAYAAAPSCQSVVGVDISDQRSSEDRQTQPENFELIVYDGYDLSAVEDNSVDIVFSYQFLEHLHPEDVALHFALVKRILKSGGCYTFDTPHRFSGPHDVSAHFGTSLDCFHFQEWSYRQMIEKLSGYGFGDFSIHRRGHATNSPLFQNCFLFAERVLGALPHVLRRKLCRPLLPSVTLTARLR